MVYDEGEFDAEDGSRVHVRGFTLLDEHGSFVARDSPFLADHDLRIVRAAGAARHNADALASPRFDPGRAVRLEPDPANVHDPDAVRILDAAAELQVGFVPRDVAADVARELRDGRRLGAFVLREFRLGRGEPRLGISILIAPLDGLTLRLDDGEQLRPWG